MPGQLLVYWDFDTQWGADRSRAGRGPLDWGMLEFTQTERLLGILDGRLPSCFAIVAASALPGDRPYHDPGLIREVHAAGHEIGSHAMRHEWLPALAPAPLREVLRESRAVLEGCTGSEVTAFVPPYNQPFDHARALSFSLSERRAVRTGRTDIPALCRALRDTGYRTSRISYRPWPWRLADLVARRSIDRPVAPRVLEGVTTVLLNTPGGFGPESVAMVRRVAREGGLAVVYAHPHSLGTEGPQSAHHLLAFLDVVDDLRHGGHLRVVQPRELLASPVAA